MFEKRKRVAQQTRHQAQEKRREEGRKETGVMMMTMRSTDRKIGKREDRGRGRRMKEGRWRWFRGWHSSYRGRLLS